MFTKHRASALVFQEFPDMIEKNIEAIMMQPMPGILYIDTGGVFEVRRPAIGNRIGGPAFGAAK